MTVGKRILVVEDDQALASVLADNLTFEGFEVRMADDSHTAVRVAREIDPDLVILDVMLPHGVDGFELCQVLRQRGKVAVIMLTARVQKADKLRAFDLGADDYVTKPFDMAELLARIRAVLRRSRPSIESLVLGSVKIDFVSLVAERHALRIHMSQREFDVLRYLAERADRVVHRDELLRAVWGYPETPTTRSVDHAIARIRKKLEEDPHHPRFIHTVHGNGYLLTPKGRTDISHFEG